MRSERSRGIRGDSSGEGSVWLVDTGAAERNVSLSAERGGSPSVRIVRKKTKDSTSIEEKFDYLLDFDTCYQKVADRFPRPVSQYRFGKWYIDRAYPEYKIAIELNGGSGGGYGRPIHCQNCGSVVRARLRNGGFGKPLRLPYPSHAGKGAERDAAKSNALVLAGWKVLTFTSAQLNSDPAGVISQVIAALELSNRDRSAELSGGHIVLTDRETEVLQMLAEGKTASSIGFQLGISSRTAETHIQHVREKFGVKTTTAAVALAISKGIVDVKLS